MKIYNQINIKKYTLRDLINYYSNKINNLSKKEQQKFYPFLDESLDMNSPPKEITKKILNKLDKLLELQDLFDFNILLSIIVYLSIITIIR